MVHARLSESNLVGQALRLLLKFGEPTRLPTNGNANVPFCLLPRSVFSIRRPMLDVRRFRLKPALCSSPQCLAGALQFLDLVAERFLGFAEFLLKTSQQLVFFPFTKREIVIG